MCLIKGITQLNQIITENERVFILREIKNAQLNSESGNFHYGNSEGSQLPFDEIFDRLTNEIKLLTGLSIEKQNSYSRIYKDGSFLKEHTDREGLDLTLSIQIENTFNEVIPIYAKGYDGTVYQSDLTNCDSVLLKGRELPHWRNEINGNGELVCVFFHWNITGIEYQEIENFLTESECDEIIKRPLNYGDSMVLVNNMAVSDENIRSNKVSFCIDENIDNKLKQVIGNLKLEGLQILKYNKGNKFTPHHDYLFAGSEGYKRLFTMLIYLNDDCIGGETNFPIMGIKINPKKGKLLIWKNLLPNGELNQMTLHESMPVTKGTKHALVNWGLVLV